MAAGLFQSDEVEFKLFLTAGCHAQCCQRMSNVSVTEIVFGWTTCCPNFAWGHPQELIITFWLLGVLKWQVKQCEIFVIPISICRTFWRTCHQAGFAGLQGSIALNTEGYVMSLHRLQQIQRCGTVMATWLWLCWAKWKSRFGWCELAEVWDAHFKTLAPAENSTAGSTMKSWV